MNESDFVHTHVHTEYSMLDGHSRINALVAEAKRLGQRALAITDHGNMHGVPDFHDACVKAGITPIVGMEGYIVDDVNVREGRSADYNHLLLFAQNQVGYQNLLKLVTRSHVEGFWRKPRIDKAMLEEHSNGLIVTTGCLAGEIPELIRQSDEDAIERVVDWYKRVFGDRFYAEIQDHEELESPQGLVNNAIIDLARRFDLPLLATNDLHYVKQEDAATQDVMLCVQMAKDFNDPERMKFGSDNYFLKNAAQMERLFGHLPEALTNTVALAERCQGGVVIPTGLPLIPAFAVPFGFATDKEYLYYLCEQGLRWRYGAISDEVRVRLDREFKVIADKGFVSYFLIVWDYVNYARSQGMRCVARGSVAGSVVAYALGMSNIDPLRYDLMFERFLNPERNAMPDIDMDFPDDRREEVVRYIARKYGWDKVAQIVTFSTMAARAAVRDVGRVLNLRSESDAIARLIPQNMDLATAATTVSDLASLIEKNAEHRQIVEMARGLEGTVRNTGVHAAGIVISNTPLVDLTPCQPRDRKVAGGWLLTQYGQDQLERIGLLKMDCLGLSNLSILQRTVKLIEESRGEKLDIDAIPVDDLDAFKLLAAGETTGIFQLESPNMRAYIKELKPSRLEDITAMVALYRPGPMDSIPRYIRAKHNPEQITYPHPRLEGILRETYGVLVYQDQVLLTAVQLAGFTWGEVDKFRKAIGKKIREELLKYRDKFIKGCVANGIDKATAEQLFELIEPFGGYGFNKAHAASYALVAYQTAYLKAHYPAEFFAASLTTEAGDPKKVTAILEDCRRRDITVLPPDINRSGREFSVERTSIDSDAVRFGLSAIKNLGDKTVDGILAARQAGGDYRSMAEVFARAEKFSTGHAQALAKAGAFDCFNTNRAQLLAAIEASAKRGRAWRSRKSAEGHPLDEFTADIEPLAPRERLAAEFEMLGFYVSGHPLAEFAAQIRATATKYSAELTGDDDCQKVKLVGRVVEVKKIKTRTGDTMARAVIEDLQGFMDIVVFAGVYVKTSTLWRPGVIVVIDGEYRHSDEKQQVIAKAVERFIPETKKKGEETAPQRVLRVRVGNNVATEGAHAGMPTGPNVALVSRARAILADHKGEEEYEIVDDAAGRVLSKGKGNKGVSITDELLTKLVASGFKHEFAIVK
ncbi:MAG: DNA polymerase III subunit alpha [Ktedonobacterales bacterium]